MEIQGQNHQDSAANQAYRTLHISNLEPDLTIDDLKQYFGQHGEVLNVRISKDQTGKSKGFGFITFKNVEDSKRIRRELNYSKIRDNEIKLSYNRIPSLLNKRANLFISNLDGQVSDRELEEACQEYGEIISSKIRRDQYGNGQGFAYVQFVKPSEADNCISGLNGRMLGSKAVKVDRFIPKEKRPRKYYNRNRYQGGGSGGYMNGFNMQEMMMMMNMMQMQMNMQGGGMGVSNPYMMMQNQLNPAMVKIEKIF